MASNSNSSNSSSSPSAPSQIDSFTPTLDASTQTAGVIAAWVIMTVVAGVTVGLRFYTRRVIIRVLGVEDWLILVAMVFLFPFPSSSLFFSPLAGLEQYANWCVV